MLVKDKFDTIFTGIKEVSPLAIFDLIDDVTLNNLYILKYGNRKLNSKGQEIDFAVLSNILNVVYGSKWDNIYLSMIEGIEQLKVYSEIIKETVTDEGSLELTRDSINKISAYNVDDFVNDKSDENIESNLTTNLKVREFEVNKVKDSKHFKDIMLFLNNSNIHDILYTDINDLITLSIY